MSVRSLIETYTGRWDIETTFEEVRSYLRLETTRGWGRDTVLRVGPCLFALSTIVVWLHEELPGRGIGVRVVDWPGKHDVTFSDAITVVRRWLWREWVLAIPGHHDAFEELTPGSQRLPLNGLTQVA